MRPSPECRPRLWDGLVAAAVIALAVSSAALTWGGGQQGRLTAVVEIGGETVDRLSLAAGERTYQANGYTLTVVSDGSGVAVSASDCPTQDCVRTGAITRAGQSIVCLPARLSVTLTGGSGGVDAVIG